MQGTGLRHLKKWLEKNDISDAAREVGITPIQASNVMSGRCQNWTFSKIIIEKAAKNKALSELANSI
jgi:hypothetical protein